MPKPSPARQVPRFSISIRSAGSWRRGCAQGVSSKAFRVPLHRPKALGFVSLPEGKARRVLLGWRAGPLNPLRYELPLRDGDYSDASAAFHAVLFGCRPMKVAGVNAARRPLWHQWAAWCLGVGAGPCASLHMARCAFSFRPPAIDTR